MINQSTVFYVVNLRGGNLYLLTRQSLVQAWCFMRKKNPYYDPNKTERTFVNGAVKTTKIVAGAAVIIGGLGLLGSLFGGNK